MAESAPMLGSNGLPELSAEAANEKSTKTMGTMAVMMTVPRLVGTGIAFAVYKLGDHHAYERAAGVLGESNLGYLGLAVYVWSFTVFWLNIYPMVHKAKLGLTGNLNSNMAIFKVLTAKTDKTLPYVVMEEDGAIGEYNRANRSMFNFNEHASGIIACVLCAGMVFPCPTLVATSTFAVGRMLHQVGYSKGGYGKHAPGFAIAIVSQVTLEGMVLIGSLSALGVL